MRGFHFRHPPQPHHVGWSRNSSIPQRGRRNGTRRTFSHRASCVGSRAPNRSKSSIGDTIPESQRTPFPLDEHLVHKSSFFGPIDITTLKKKVLIPCTSFEVLAASLWRARTMALRLDPSDELRFMFPVNLRVRMSPYLPAGYYGNVLVYPAVLSTVKKLCESPLCYAVELVKKAKAKATANISNRWPI